MIRAEFLESNGLKIGFKLSGHAGYADSGSDIVCAAVSSAVQLTANTLDLLGHSPDVKVRDNVIECTIASKEALGAALIESLRLHLQAISEDYPKTIKITISEV